MGCFYYKCALTNSVIPAGAKVYMYIAKPDNTNALRLLHKVYNDYREKEDESFKQSVHEI